MFKLLVKKTLLSVVTVCIFLSTPVTNAEENGNFLHQKIERMKGNDVKFFQVELFDKIVDTEKEFQDLQRTVPISLSADSAVKKQKSLILGAEFLHLKPSSLASVIKLSPKALTLKLPFAHQTESGNNKDVKLKLFKRSIYTKDAKFIFQDAQSGKSKTLTKDQIDLGIHYQGIVEGEAQSIVAISIFNDAIEGRIHSTNLGDLNIGRIRDKNNRLKKEKNKLADSHVVYRVSNIADKRPKHNCKVDGHDLEGYLSHLNIEKEGTAKKATFDKDDFLSAMGTTNRMSTNGLYDYYFTNYTVISGYLASEIGSSYISNWIGSVLNQVSAVYNVDGLLFYSEGWKSYNNSPVYDGQEGAYLLEQFAYYDKTAVENSDVGMLLTSAKTSSSANYGLAYKIGGICSYDIVDGLAYSPMNVAYNYFPTYSWTVDVYAHEAGHTLGSPHTHNCSWNGNNTAIDSCGGFTEGTCPLPGSPAWGQGTVMSYCSGSVGKNPALGFASQPAAKIANHIYYCADR